MSEEKRYFAADTEFTDELSRIRLLEQERDPITIRHLVRLGVSKGWRCLEVGAGGGSIARWLSERVGPTGRVVIIDIDPRFIDDFSLPNVIVRREDIATAEVEADSYDLVHCRALLMHLADPEAVVRRLVRALRVGAWVLAEEADGITWAAADPSHPLAQTHNEIGQRMFDFWRAAGKMDLFLGRALPALFHQLGLADVGNEGIARVMRGGEPWARLMEKSFQRADEAMLAKGILTESEIAKRRRALDDPSFYFRNLLLDSCWGRREK